VGLAQTRALAIAAYSAWLGAKNTLAMFAMTAHLTENALRSETDHAKEGDGMCTNAHLQEAILNRRSIRRYDRQPLDERSLIQVDEITSSTEPLVAGNHFAVLFRDAPPGTDLVGELGGYGRIVNPPHYLVPYVVGECHQLEEAGYGAQQIAVRLTALGIGSCFVGALRREPEVRSLHGLPADARIGAFLTVGRPSTGVGGRAINRLLRVAAGASRKMPAKKLFFDSSFKNPTAPAGSIAPLIEAARHAPSAVNAQPWRFLMTDQRLYVFATKSNIRYGTGPQEEYRFHDVGAAMANISLMLQALDMRGSWTMDVERAPDTPSHPPALEPVAYLTIDETR
jgi:nitroreductase